MSNSALADETARKIVGLLQDWCLLHSVVVSKRHLEDEGMRSIAAAIREAEQAARVEQKIKDAAVAHRYYEQPVETATPNDDYETGAMDNALAIEGAIKGSPHSSATTAAPIDPSWNETSDARRNRVNMPGHIESTGQAFKKMGLTP